MPRPIAQRLVSANGSKQTYVSNGWKADISEQNSDAECRRLVSRNYSIRTIKVAALGTSVQTPSGGQAWTMRDAQTWRAGSSIRSSSVTVLH
jgi:hypothetical protein